MKGARTANTVKVTKVALIAGIINKQESKLYNPFTSYVTKTHIIYVHSGIEHFIKVN